MMISKNADREAYVWTWLPGATEPVVAGKLELDDQGNVQFNYGQSYLELASIASSQPEFFRSSSLNA